MQKHKVMQNNSLMIMFRIMKWCIKMVLVITGILPLAKCGSGYREEGGKVTFNGEEITDKSFLVLNDNFGKSDAAAYYKRYSIPGADIATFTGLDKHYAKDKGAVYYCDEEREGKNYYLTKHSVIINIKDARPATFSVLGEGYEGYAKDGKRAYFKGTGFEVKDVTTLAIVSGQFVKDKYLVYFDQAPVKGADPGSFRVLNNCYARDTDRIYYFGYHSDLHNGIYEIPCQAATFTILDYPYSKDANAVFYLYTRIQDADAATFSIAGNNFSRDKNHVYSGAKKLTGADASTFRVLPRESSLDEGNYSKDQYQAYWKDKGFTVTDVAAFMPVGLGYATDGKRVYYKSKMVKDADPATFKIYDHGYGDADAEDKKGKYLRGIKIEEE